MSSCSYRCQPLTSCTAEDSVNWPLSPTVFPVDKTDISFKVSILAYERTIGVKRQELMRLHCIFKWISFYVPLTRPWFTQERRFSLEKFLIIYWRGYTALLYLNSGWSQYWEQKDSMTWYTVLFLKNIPWLSGFPSIIAPPHAIGKTCHPCCLMLPFDLCWNELMSNCDEIVRSICGSCRAFAVQGIVRV